MFINKVSLSSIKQNFSAKLEQVGSFCGRKVEQFKACASPKLARIQSIASNALSMISTKMHSAKKALIATKDYIVSKVSDLAARIFKKAKAPAVQTSEMVVAAALAPQRAEEDPAPQRAEEDRAPQRAEEASSATPRATTRSGRRSIQPNRYGFETK